LTIIGAFKVSGGAKEVGADYLDGHRFTAVRWPEKSVSLPVQKFGN